MIYLDSNVFIYAALNMKPVADKCIKIMNDIANKKIEVCTSILTWDEFFYSIKRSLGTDYAVLESERLLRFLNLTFLDANVNTILLAQRLSTRYNIGPRDAIHAATAIANKCGSIISDDSDFDKVKELKRIKP
ncbi:type II toxin-antitoxin system VapC family toxin [Candidatus Pacearchaeota archaeon]|nr:type II toxin-antitoxin system VapC family toxin [Candidatus Pacearchaeota archaeon]